MTIRLADLNDDVIIKLAFDCAPGDVLALERTCRTFRNLFSVPMRPLWLHHIQQLDDFHAPDLPPHVSIEALSSSELKRLVSRAVSKYKNWNRPSSSGPRVTRRRIMDLKNKGNILGEIKGDSEDVKIVPGGRFVCTLWSGGYLRCWDIEKNKLLLTYPPLGYFSDRKVVAFDVEYNASAGQLLIAVTGACYDHASLTGFIELHWLNPQTGLMTRMGSRGLTNHEYFTFVRLCRTAIILKKAASHYSVMDKKLDKWITLMDVDIARETISVSDGYLIFVGKEASEHAYSLFALDAERILTSPHAERVPLLSLPPTILNLRNYVLKTPLPVFPLSTRLVVCKAPWRGSGITHIYIAAENSEALFTTQPSSSTTFSVLSYELITQSYESVLPPSLSLLQFQTPVSVPLSHPYCKERVHCLSHAGHGLLSSTNNLHKGTRYFAISMEHLLEGRVQTPLAPISFGRDLVAPSEVYMEKYSGALAFVTKDGQSLVIQYYD